MTDPALARSFLRGEIEALAPFDFVLASPAGEPLQVVEVTRLEEDGLEVRVPGRPPVVPELPAPVRAALRERGFASEDPADRTRPWTHAAVDAEDATDTALRVLHEVFEAAPDHALDVAHGSHRAEHEAEQKLAGIRERVEKVLSSMAEVSTRDEDGDYVLPRGDVHVVVAPRVPPGGPALLRVFAITNVAVNVTPELGLFLARLNFGMMFGRFALDAEHRAIWFDETLLGDHFTDDELRFVVDVVARTADAWDDRMKQMFGGATYEEVRDGRTPQPAPTVKPGHGGYV
ncbi:MAG: YbjN domain-containing protein [Myxococcota bacterium]|nr:YbjN domain-containing protein [Myxococcota bacterium]